MLKVSFDKCQLSLGLTYISITLELRNVRLKSVFIGVLNFIVSCPEDEMS